MRKLLISLATAAVTLGVAAPASAQWAPPPPRYGYGTPGAVENYQARVQNIRMHVREMAARGVISYRQANRLEREAAAIDRQIWGKSRHGLSWGDRAYLDQRIGRFQQWVEMAAREGRGYGRRW